VTEYLKRANIADAAGWLCEDVRASEQGEIAQVYHTTVLPGKVKGWHRHGRKTDRVFCVAGMARIVLAVEDVSLAAQIVTGRGQQYEIVLDKTIGPVSPGVVVIPPGVWHAFACVGPETAVIVNAPDREYDPADPDQEELELGAIPFDWEGR
jgi:dTDP-4-dehydrorhamnose 3,5-epimerase